jgi:hypothetical protein
MPKNKQPTNRKEAAELVRLAHAGCIRWNLEMDRARGLVNEASRVLQEHRAEMARKQSKLKTDSEDWRALLKTQDELSRALSYAELRVRFVEGKQEDASDHLIQARTVYYDISEREDGRNHHALLQKEHDRVKAEFDARNMVRPFYEELKEAADRHNGSAIGNLQWLKDHWRQRDVKAVADKYGHRFNTLPWRGAPERKPNDRELAKQLVEFALHGCDL